MVWEPGVKTRQESSKRGLVVGEDVLRRSPVERGGRGRTWMESWWWWWWWPSRDAAW